MTDELFEEIENLQPEYASPEWQPYVLSLLSDSEWYETPKKEKVPRVAGLKRVARLLFDIVFAGPEWIQTVPAASQENPPNATVVYKIVYRGEEGTTREVRATASGNHWNCVAEYAIHPEAMAETRAQGRALRELLCLDVVSAEEVNTPDDADSIVESYRPKKTELDDASVFKTKKTMVLAFCKRNGVQVNKLVAKALGEEKGIDFISVDEIIKVVNLMNKYQNKEIPGDLK